MTRKADLSPFLERRPSPRSVPHEPEIIVLPAAAHIACCVIFQGADAILSSSARPYTFNVLRNAMAVSREREAPTTYSMYVLGVKK